jgi:hypothetical protein
VFVVSVTAAGLYTFLREQRQSRAAREELFRNEA